LFDWDFDKIKKKNGITTIKNRNMVPIKKFKRKFLKEMKYTITHIINILILRCYQKNWLTYKDKLIVQQVTLTIIYL